MADLLDIFPFIKETKRNFIEQTKFLDKVVLTGKINALDTAKNLFDFTSQTSKSFIELQEDLVEILINENLNKLQNELHSKAQVAIDILIRNLFERTADVGFLATDEEIIRFLKEKEGDINSLRERLVEYTKKYSVYDEIVVLDCEGSVKANMNGMNTVSKSSDEVVKQALASDSYIEFYRNTDIFPSQNNTLVYAQKISDDGQDLGVLCLCFRFDDELERIFNDMITDQEKVILTYKGRILASSSASFPVDKVIKTNISQEYEILQNHVVVSCETKGYQGYYGQGWTGVALQPVIKSFSQTDSQKEEDFVGSLIKEELTETIEKADSLVEDLADVIINGELIASKKKVYVLTPILENLRNISSELLKNVKTSIHNLQVVVKEALVYDSKFASHLAIDIMDRNLYERANDCRWWALTPTFINELSKEKPDEKELNGVLEYINELYTVYTNLYIYDKNLTIVAASKEHSVIGKKLNSVSGRKTLSNLDTQNYFVSSFEKSPFYNDEATYIYNASINDGEGVLGGIGIVFDSTPEFKAILEDSFPIGKKGFSLFADRNKKIISSTNPELKPLDSLELEESFFRIEQGKSASELIEFMDKKYVLGYKASSGYREYKVEDNYQNDVIAFTFIEI